MKELKVSTGRKERKRKMMIDLKGWVKTLLQICSAQRQEGQRKGQFGGPIKRLRASEDEILLMLPTHVSFQVVCAAGFD